MNNLYDTKEEFGCVTVFTNEDGRIGWSVTGSSLQEAISLFLQAKAWAEEENNGYAFVPSEKRE